MKKLLLTAAAVFALTTVNAQDITFGVKAGINFANTNVSDSDENLDGITSFHFGGVVEFSVSETFSIQPELLYSAQGTSDSEFKLNLDYEINNARIIYNDSVSKMYVTVDKLMHSGKGNVSAAVSDLDTSTDLELSMEMGGVKYTKEMPINLRALLEVDQENQRYTFKENEGHLNQIPLVFSGWVQQQENATNLDVSFNSEKASFK